MYDGSEGGTEIAIRRGISSSNSASRRILKPRTACRLADGIEEGCHGCSDCYVDQIFLYGVRNLEWCGWPTRHHGHHGAGQDRGAITRVRSSPSLFFSPPVSYIHAYIHPYVFVLYSRARVRGYLSSTIQNTASEFLRRRRRSLYSSVVSSRYPSDHRIVGLLDRWIVGSLDRWLLV